MERHLYYDVIEYSFPVDSSLCVDDVVDSTGSQITVFWFYPGHVSSVYPLAMSKKGIRSKYHVMVATKYLWPV